MIKINISGLISNLIFFVILSDSFLQNLSGQFVRLPEYKLETGIALNTGEQAPFWQVSNRFDRYSHKNASGFLGGALISKADTSRNFAIGYGLDAFYREDGESRIRFQQAYLETRFHFLRFMVGQKEEINSYPWGLSSGLILWSENTRPMPEIVLEVPDYTSFPLSWGYLQFKGQLAHGWFGDEGYVKGTLLHRKYVIVRAGGKLPVNLSMGLHHFAMWGGNSPDTSIGKLPSDPETYLKVFFSRNKASSDPNLPANEALNRIGNHLGSWSYKLDLNLDKFQTGIYYQTLFEDYSGFRKFIMKDGLWGVYFRSKGYSLPFTEIVFEFLNTRFQSGPPKAVTSEFTQGNDNFFNNNIYRSGWTYYSGTIGTPFICSPWFFSSGTPGLINNRVLAQHMGIRGEINPAISYKLLLSYSQNYGTYNKPLKEVESVTSIGLEYAKTSKKHTGLEYRIQISADLGELYGNNAGVMVTLCKKGIFADPGKK